MRINMENIYTYTYVYSKKEGKKEERQIKK